MTIENREHERKSFLTEMVLDFRVRRRQVRVTDVSAGGCYVETIVSVQVGDEVKFELGHPDGHSVPFTGEVAYHFEVWGLVSNLQTLPTNRKSFSKAYPVHNYARGTYADKQR
jgi:hypothetical protein